jgi:hypothetical protein
METQRTTGKIDGYYSNRLKMVEKRIISRVTKFFDILASGTIRRAWAYEWKADAGRVA